MDTIQGSLKDDIREVKSDLRKLLYALAAGILGLGALMAHGFHWF